MVVVLAGLLMAADAFFSGGARELLVSDKAVHVGAGTALVRVGDRTVIGHDPVAMAMVRSPLDRAHMVPIFSAPLSTVTRASLFEGGVGLMPVVASLFSDGHFFRELTPVAPGHFKVSLAIFQIVLTSVRGLIEGHGRVYHVEWEDR